MAEKKKVKLTPVAESVNKKFKQVTLHTEKDPNDTRVES